MGKQRRSFSEEFKPDPVGRVADGKHPRTQVARERDVHPHVLQVWRKNYGTQQAQSVPQDGKSRLKMRSVASDAKTLVYAKIATS